MDERSARILEYPQIRARLEAYAAFPPSRRLAAAMQPSSDPVIVRRALEEPCRQIAENAGVEGAVVIDKIKAGKTSFGFNAATEEYEDLIAAGIIDPTKVTRSALQNAASIAALMITTEALIADKPEDKKEMPGGGHGGGMGGMGGMM